MPGFLAIRLGFFYGVLSAWVLLMGIIWASTWWTIAFSPFLWLSGYYQREALKYWYVTQRGHELEIFNKPLYE